MDQERPNKASPSRVPIPPLPDLSASEGHVGRPGPREELVMGRYALGPEIGRGGMSTVYQATDTQLGRLVAVKVLAPHLSLDPHFRQRFLAEAQAAAKLPHPHVVQVYDAGISTAGQPGAESTSAIGNRRASERVGNSASDGLPASPTDGAMVLVMELVPGESLQQRLQRGPLPCDQARAIGAQVADALAFAHKRGIIHRDVKPHNILLAPAPGGARLEGGGDNPSAPPPAWAKLADFGIARLVDATHTFTTTGAIIGSAPYLAPELLQGQAASERSDAYALGVTLFQMLTGQRPFQGSTTAATLTARLVRDAPRVRSLRPDVPSGIDDLIAQCLARDPLQRPSELALVAQVLRQPDAAATTRLMLDRPEWHEATTQVLPALPAAAAAPAHARVGGQTEEPQIAVHRQRQRQWTRPLFAVLGAGLVSLALTTWTVMGAATTRDPAGTSDTSTAAAQQTTMAASEVQTPEQPVIPTPTAIVIRLR